MLPEHELAFRTERGEILSAIRGELAYFEKPACFEVEQRYREGDVWCITVRAGDAKGVVLDESLEGHSAWWPGPPKGAADVLSVLPENQQINLRFATTSPPDAGERLFIYPQRYLDALQRCWSDLDWANRCLAWLEKLKTDNRFDVTKVVRPNSFPRLRKRQAKAFELLGWDAGFLRGPPGTGKTYTVGALLAQYMIDYPQAKVLLVSTTNSAVDQALVSVDRALESLKHPQAHDARKRCVRLGTHFLAQHYAGRSHLLPKVDEEGIRKLIALESQQPDPGQVQAHANWKRQKELLQKSMRQNSVEQLQRAQLVAMTTTRAAFTQDELRQIGPYSLLVCDEASQVSVAHAAALSPLASRVLFAGDPDQLAPIAQSDTPDARRWLKRSIFDRVEKDAACSCFLNEQSRMAEPICNVVSQTFYRGELIVAADAKVDSRWKAERALDAVPCFGTKSTVVETIGEEGTWSQKWHGPIRYASASRITDIVASLLETIGASDVVVLTPFRAQRALIRSMLRRNGNGRVSVSTVHRAQGSERHTVIFDPVDGDSDFLANDDGKQLINVALSRAKARLIVCLSVGDRVNATLDRIGYLLAAIRSEQSSGVVPVGTLARLPDFPQCAVGKTIQIGTSITGEVLEVIADGAKFILLDATTGEKKTIATKVIVQNYGKGN